MNEEKEAFRELKELKNKIPKNTYNTIKGQIRSGRIESALLGIRRLKERNEIKPHAGC